MLMLHFFFLGTLAANLQEELMIEVFNFLLHVLIILRVLTALIEIRTQSSVPSWGYLLSLPAPMLFAYILPFWLGLSNFHLLDPMLILLVFCIRSLA